MNNCCFICNTQTGVSLENSVNLFEDQNNLPSGCKLQVTVSEIIEKPLNRNAVHTTKICNKCHEACSEYDEMKMHLKSMKTKIMNQFKASISNHNISYDSYELDVLKTQAKKAEAASVKKNIKKVVLPASKLQPVPPDLLKKVGNLAALKNINNAENGKPKSMPIINTTLPNIKNSKSPKETYYLTVDPLENTDRSLASDTVKGIDLSNLTKDLLDDEDDANSGKNHGMEGDENDDNLVKDDQDCTVSVLPVTSANGDLVLEVHGIKPISKTGDGDQYVDVEMDQCDMSTNNGTTDDKYVLGKLQLLNQVDDDDDDDDDDQEHAIMFYDGNELSLIVPNRIEDSQNGDSQDSNEDSQIELQMSGDEETANAIIAAAQEQGGAFIKVSSGEMYRVQSVHSKNEDEMEKQLLRMVIKEDDKFRCLLCENSIKNGTRTESFLSDAESMMRHLKQDHDARLYICSICGQVMRKRSVYCKHIFSEHGSQVKSLASGNVTEKRPSPRLYTCTVCNKSYNSRILLLEHSNTHSGVRPHSCTVCQKSFASKYTLHTHLKTHSVRPRPYKCKECDKSFLTQQNLNQHEKTHAGVKDFICNICDKAFSTQHNLEVHGVVHSKARPHSCTNCPKTFARAAELRDHMRIHTGERPFACDICGATFTQRSNLHSHRRATHFGEKPHTCPHCQKRFKRRRLLNYHIKAMHTGERPLQCDICHSTFVYPEHYKKHIRIHSGERPFMCEICGKAFSSRDNRNTHRFTHSDRKPYECLSCGAGYMRKSLLYAHMNSSGHLTESIVVNQPRVTKVSTANLGTEVLEVQSVETKSYDELFPTSSEVLYDANQVSVSVKNEAEDNLQFYIADRDVTVQEDSSIAIDKPILENVDMEQLGNAEIVTSDGGTEMVRLIQIKLADGNDGWMALNN